MFTVDRGVKHKVVAVDLEGNKYFTDDLLRERMRVQKGNAYQRSGRYSPALVAADVSAIQALYRANGFDEAKVTTDVKDVSTLPNGKPLKVGRDCGDLHDCRGAAAEVRYGGVEWRGCEPDGGCEGD